MSINAFTAIDFLNTTTYPEPTNSATNGRNQMTSALSLLTNQLTQEVTNKLNDTATNGGGAGHIGCTNVATGAGTNIYSNLVYLNDAIINVAVGSIANDSLTESMMAAEMKKDINGGVQSYSESACLFKAGSSNYTDNDTSQTFTDAFCTSNSLVTVVVNSASIPEGIWSVASANGSFTITSTSNESTDIAFDYYIQKAVV